MLQLWLLSSKLQAMCPKVPCIDYLAHTVTSNISMEVYGVFPQLLGTGGLAIPVRNNATRTIDGTAWSDQLICLRFALRV